MAAPTSATGSLGLAPPRIRPSAPRALAALSAAVVLRLLREGLVVRALAWPGLLTALSMFLSAAITIAWRSSPVIIVHDAALVPVLEAAEFRVTVDADPESWLHDGRAERAVWKEDDHLVLGSTWGGTLTFKAESVLREHTGDRWRLVLPPPPKRSRDSEELNPVTGLLAGIVGLLFTLYGVVIGAGSLYRDRASGALESDLALAVPRWLHAASRLVALAAVLGPALVVSLVVVDALLPIDRLGSWMFDGFVASVAGGTLGVVLMARAGSAKGFSAALSQALTAAMGLLSLGYWKPAIGSAIPLCSLGAAFAHQHSSWMVVPVALVAAAATSAWFGRREVL